MSDRKFGTLILKFANASRFSRRAIAVVAAVLILLVGLALVSRSGLSGSGSFASTYTVGRGDLVISFSTSGNIKARSSVDIKSEVEGRTTIISIVSEGTYITEEDVKNGKVLVELESSDLKERLTRDEISFAGTEASYTEAQEAYKIQVKQNTSDIAKGEMELTFERMDLKKYLGETLAEKLINDDGENGDPVAEIAGLIDSAELEGQGRQELRRLAGDIALAKERLERARDTLDWTKQLYEKEYVSENDLKADRLDVNQKTIALEQAKTSDVLFRRYEFPKEAAKCYGDYREAERELDRIRARTRSKLAQALANLKSQEATYNLQKDRLGKLKKQIEACTIKAPAVGLVAYGSSSNWRRQRSPIEIGETVHHRQKILRIPNTSQMAVDVEVHEASINKVRPGLKARITVDALPDETFFGEVLTVAPLPTPQRWINPDLKVYLTEISIEGTHELLKLGLSAKVEIIVAELHDVINIPVQAVANRNGSKVCYVANSGEPRQQKVKVGQFNETFIEIISGLKAGQKVLLNPPRLLEANNATGSARDTQGRPEQKQSQRKSDNTTTQKK